MISTGKKWATVVKRLVMHFITDVTLLKKALEEAKMSPIPRMLFFVNTENQQCLKVGYAFFPLFFKLIAKGSTSLV